MITWSLHNQNTHVWLCVVFCWCILSTPIIYMTHEWQHFGIYKYVNCAYMSVVLSGVNAAISQLLCHRWQECSYSVVYPRHAKDNHYQHFWSVCIHGEMNISEMSMPVKGVVYNCEALYALGSQQCIQDRRCSKDNLCWMQVKTVLICGSQQS